MNRNTQAMPQLVINEFQAERFRALGLLELYGMIGAGREIIIFDVDRMDAIQTENNTTAQDHTATILDYGTVKEKRHELYQPHPQRRSQRHPEADR